MSTNRTKIDWAYKWAQKFLDEARDYDPKSFGIRSNDPDDIRALAALLRRAARRGQGVPWSEARKVLAPDASKE